MINTETIPKGRPSPKQVELNKWKMNEMILKGLVTPYDSGNSKNRDTLKLTQFKSDDEYCEAILKAFDLLKSFQPVPEPMRTKLILEAENFRKHSKSSCLV